MVVVVVVAVVMVVVVAEHLQTQNYGRLKWRQTHLQLSCGEGSPVSFALRINP